MIGMDADLAKALAQSMGLTADVKNVGFGAIIPGLAANRYDLGMSSFTITKEREQAVDFVSYAIRRVRPCTSRPPVARTSGHWPTSAATASESSRHDSGAGCQGAGQEVQGRGQVRRDDQRVPGPERREPVGLERPGRGGHGRLTRCGLHRRPVERPVQADRHPFGTAALRNRDAEGQWAGQAVTRRRQGADGGWDLQEGPHVLGPRRTRQRTAVRARSRIRSSTQRTYRPARPRDDPARRAGAVAGGGGTSESGRPPEEIQAVPVRHPGRWIAAGIVALVAARCVGRHEPALPVGRGRRLPLRRPGPPRPA